MAGASAIGLAGCVTGSDTDNSDPAENGVEVGLVVPLSGPFGVQGENIINALELAGDQAVEAGEIADFNLRTADSESDPAVARQRSLDLIEDGVDFIQGGLDGAAAWAVGQLASQHDIIQMSTYASPTPDIEECADTFFQHDNAMPGWGESPLGYLARSGQTEKVYQVYSDGSFPAEFNAYTEDVLAPEVGIEFVENRPVPFGTTDFASIMNDAAASDADTINFVIYGEEALSALGQAAEFGLVDQGFTICLPTLDPAMGPAIPEEVLSYDNAYFGLVGGYAGIDTPANNEYTEEMRSRYDQNPGGEAVWYNGTRTLLSAAAEAGTTETSAVQETLWDYELVPDLWGTGSRFRKCDQRVTIPSVTLRGDPGGDHDAGEYFEVVEIVDDEDLIMYPCEDIACER